MIYRTKAAARTVANVAAAGLPRKVCIVGAAGMVQSGTKSAAAPSTTGMIQTVLHKALAEAKLTVRDIDGWIAVPSLSEDYFMEAHYQATTLGLFDPQTRLKRPLRCRTLDTGGAGPVSALLEAERMIQSEALECVVVVAADSVGSMKSQDFLAKADDIFLKLQTKMGRTDIQSPAIPHGYDKITDYQMQNFGLTRDQLRMAVCLESFHAALHKESLHYQYHHDRRQDSKKKNSNKKQQQLENMINDYTSLKQIQEAQQVTPNLSILECARRADGAACLVLASNRFLMRNGLYQTGLPTIIGGGESSGPLYPPVTNITESTYASCEEAMSCAYTSAGNLTANDMDFFGLYDCFPICLVRAVEACGLSPKGKGGAYLEEQYQRMMQAIEAKDNTNASKLLDDKSFFPINTHGGLLCYGAPWEVPAMYNIIEAVHQLRGQARGRQIENCRRALVYGNGGILSASAVAILANSL